MKLKKFILGLALLMFITAQTACFAEQAPDSAVKGLVSQYKARNYIGCVQSSEKILETSPSNVFAHYYKGLGYYQLGKKDLAIASFQKVIDLNGNKTLVDLAVRGVACANAAEECKQYAESNDELDIFIKSNKFYDKSVQSDVNQKRLERIKNNINEELNHNKSEMPTNDEIANAVKTLAKIGINPLSQNTAMSGLTQNPEMMQANMMLGNNNQQGGMMNNMLPMLLMSQKDGKNIPPELIQSMMMSQMTPDFGNNSNNY